MGLIRKTLMVTSMGLVRGSSKKQRVAKATLREVQAQTEILRRTAPRPTTPSLMTMHDIAPPTTDRPEQGTWLERESAKVLNNMHHHRTQP